MAIARLEMCPVWKLRSMPGYLVEPARARLGRDRESRNFEMKEQSQNFQLHTIRTPKMQHCKRRSGGVIIDVVDLSMAARPVTASLYHCGDRSLSIASRHHTNPELFFSSAVSQAFVGVPVREYHSEPYSCSAH